MFISFILVHHVYTNNIGKEVYYPLPMTQTQVACHLVVVVGKHKKPRCEFLIIPGELDSIYQPPNSFRILPWKYTAK